MATCPSCEREVPDTASICPYDGARLDTEAGRQRPVGTILGTEDEAGRRTVGTILGTEDEAGPGTAGTILGTEDEAGLGTAGTILGTEDEELPPAAPSVGSNIEAILDNVTPSIETGTMMGEYQVTRKLGEGGMGEVYGAVHPIIGKKVAIKVLGQNVASNREVVRRFIDEARSVNQIGHPNIVDVFSFGQHTDGRHFFVMEHLEGCSLEDELEDEPIFAVDKIVEILVPALDALQAAHDAGIIHRDLKPDNIYLIKKARHQGVKLLDFGIAKLGGDDQNRVQTQTGMVLGTPDYMSPEQCRGVGVDHRTDLYATGVILYRMFTGHFPFEGDEEILVLFMRVLSDPPTKPSEHASVPKAFEALILKCLAKDADDRFASAAELSAALTEAHKNPGRSAAPSGKAKPRLGTEDDVETAKLPAAPKVDAAPKPPSKDDTDIVPKVGPNPVPEPPLATPVVEEAIVQTTLRKPDSSRTVAAVLGVLALVVGVGVFLMMRGPTGDSNATAAKVTVPPKTPVATAATVVDAGAIAAVAVDAASVIDAAAKQGWITIVSDHPKSELHIDGSFIGTGRTFDRQLAPGPHKFSISAPGRKVHKQTLVIEPGKNPSLTLKLRRGKTPEKKPNTDVDKPPPDTPIDRDGTFDWKDKKKNP